eukprot:3778649-Pyramimonas_sp.AAC.1
MCARGIGSRGPPSFLGWEVVLKPHGADWPFQGLCIGSGVASLRDLGSPPSRRLGSPGDL